MRASELRERTDADLRQLLEESRRELFNLRFQLATRQLANHRRIPAVKKDIARIHTLLREREIAAQYQALTGTETAAGAAESAD